MKERLTDKLTAFALKFAAPFFGGIVFSIPAGKEVIVETTETGRDLKTGAGRTSAALLIDEKTGKQSVIVPHGANVEVTIDHVKVTAVDYRPKRDGRLGDAFINGVPGGDLHLTQSNKPERIPELAEGVTVTYIRPAPPQQR